MRARLATYAGWQFRDFFGARALALVAVTVAAAWGYASFVGVGRSAFDASGGVAARDQLRGLFESTLLVFAFTGGILAAAGLVVRDRRRGYHRVLFARPMSPARYYVQAFLVAGVGTVLLAGVGAEIFAVTVHPVSVGGAVAYVALAWLAIGGLAFALSTVTRWYAVILVLLVAGDLLLNAYVTRLRASSGGSPVVAVAQYVLPPAHVIAGLREPFARGVPAHAVTLAWPLGFGALCVAAALVALRRRPFGQ